MIWQGAGIIDAIQICNDWGINGRRDKMGFEEGRRRESGDLSRFERVPTTGLQGIGSGRTVNPCGETLWGGLKAGRTLWPCGVGRTYFWGWLLPAPRLGGLG
jgi:hypothetical protein